MGNLRLIIYASIVLAVIFTMFFGKYYFPGNAFFKYLPFAFIFIVLPLAILFSFKSAKKGANKGNPMD